MPFKYLFECAHKIAHNLLIVNPPMETITREGCRMPIKDGRMTNIVFFAAIFWPLYVCLLRDAITLLKDMAKKLSSD